MAVSELGLRGGFCVWRLVDRSLRRRLLSKCPLPLDLLRQHVELVHEAVELQQHLPKLLLGTLQHSSDDSGDRKGTVAKSNGAIENVLGPTIGRLAR